MARMKKAVTKENAKHLAKRTGKGLGKWFGVSGDPHKHEERQAAFAQRKSGFISEKDLAVIDAFGGS